MHEDALDAISGFGKPARRAACDPLSSHPAAIALSLRAELSCSGTS